MIEGVLKGVVIIGRYAASMIITSDDASEMHSNGVLASGEGSLGRHMKANARSENMMGTASYIVRTPASTRYQVLSHMYLHRGRKSSRSRKFIPRLIGCDESKIT